MPETQNGKTVFTLLEVTRSIQKTIAERYKSAYWIKAEMNKLNLYPHSGHCYPELVEKTGGRITAQIKCNLWKDDYQRINANFLSVLKEPLRDGIKILLLARISYHPEHGLTLRIMDIDPGFTLGDLEREKQQAIDQLQQLGIFTSNKHKKLPLLPQRIAIISVNTSKGYLDFLGKIENNPWQYTFFHMLFPAILQGEKIYAQISQQLRRIEKLADHFDAVAIIRGGGDEIGLTAYNDFRLAKMVAEFPIPVLSGIGHITNQTVVEMVAHKCFITPTDLANFLFEQFHAFASAVQKAEKAIAGFATRKLVNENIRLQSEVKIFQSVCRNLVAGNYNSIGNKKQSLMMNARAFVKTNAVEIVNLDRAVQHLDPQNVLRRGYSITTINGKAITTVDGLTEGTNIHTEVYNGTILSKVISAKTKKNKK
jgi:exodeoxyribonuclease VII large subunit